MLIFVLAACAHTSIQWSYLPPSVLPGTTDAVSVVVADARCKEMADEVARVVVDAGLRVTPDAPTRLLLNLCSVELGMDNPPAVASGGSGGTPMDPIRLLRGSGSAALTVEVNGSPTGMIRADGSRVRRMKDTDANALVHRARLQQGVINDVVARLVADLVPPEEPVERRWFADPAPGSWRALHNRAVEAERAGRCGDAIRFAAEASLASSRPFIERYLLELREHCRPE